MNVYIYIFLFFVLSVLSIWEIKQHGIAPVLIKLPMVVIVLWMLFASWDDRRSQVAFINIFCIIVFIIGAIRLYHNIKSGVWLIVSSCLFAYANSLFFATAVLVGQESVVISTITIFICLSMILLFLQLEKDGEKWYNALNEPESWSSKLFTGLFSFISIFAFVAIVIVLPTYRTISDGTSFYRAYLSSDGVWYPSIVLKKEKEPIAAPSKGKDPTSEMDDFLNNPKSLTPHKYGKKKNPINKDTL